MAIDFIPRKQQKKILESDIQKKVMEWLKEQPDIVCWKASDMYTRGVSDTICCINGLFVAIELKVPGKIPTQLQKDFINRVNNINGLAFYCDTVQQVKDAVEYIRRMYPPAFDSIKMNRSCVTVSQEKLVIK